MLESRRIIYGGKENFIGWEANSGTTAAGARRRTTLAKKVVGTVRVSMPETVEVDRAWQVVVFSWTSRILEPT